MDRWDVIALIGIAGLGLGLGLLQLWLGITVAGAALLVVGIGGGVLAGRADARADSGKESG
ncbi:hypothetical protein ABZ714_19530 [Streptomyces sp. NPDC006798]|uniref:hypothetical protein n=1 Tax=Streptomyces sp. NPDC006798 TaxID=3155462 RepID=UPI0033D31DBF